MDNQINTNVPNGGWGWMVVAAVAFINMTNQSIASVFGLLFGGQLLAMNKDTSTAALITNLNCLALNLSGLFIGPVIKSFSPRKVAAAGCIFTTTGLVLCAYSSAVWHFIIGYSLICGIGQGLIAPSTFMAINSYFTTKRGRAVGISLAGSGLGQMMVPHIVRVFLDHYGFRGAVLSMAGFALNGLIGVYMFRPLKQPTEPRRNNQRDRNLLMQSEKDGKQIPEVKIVMADTVENTTHQSKTKKLCNKIFHRLVQAMDLELLRDPVFWSIFIGLALVYTSTTNFTMLFPYFLQSHVGLSRPDTALCMSVVAGADICSRLLLPFITDKLKVPYRVVFLFGTIGLLISRSALAESSTLINIIVMSAFTGMAKSATVVNNNLSVSSYCRPEKLPGALGLNMISKAILVVSLGQVLGLIRDITGSYVIGLHSQNILLVIVILFWTPEILYSYWKKRDKCRSNLSTKGNEEEHAKINNQNAC